MRINAQKQKHDHVFITVFERVLTSEKSVRVLLQLSWRLSVWRRSLSHRSMDRTFSLKKNSMALQMDDSVDWMQRLPNKNWFHECVFSDPVIWVTTICQCRLVIIHWPHHVNSICSHLFQYLSVSLEQWNQNHCYCQAAIVCSVTHTDWLTYNSWWWLD